jgi:hypothetical protein
VTCNSPKDRRLWRHRVDATSDSGSLSTTPINRNQAFVIERVAHRRLCRTAISQAPQQYRHKV